MRWTGIAVLLLALLQAPAPASDPLPLPTPEAAAVADVRVLLYSGPGPILLAGDQGTVVEEEGREPLVVASLALPEAAAEPAGRRWRVRSLGETVLLDGRAYRGEMDVFLDGAIVQVVNRVPLEDYLRGVVPRELASSQEEAVKAQAVLARTYALARLKGPAVRYDVKDDTSHQVYGGRAAETPGSDAAVLATRGLVLDWQGRLAAHSLYHSTCGGRTEDNEQVFGSTAVPYLRAVDCLAPDGLPWCRDSKYAAWEARWTSEGLGQDLGAGLGKPVPPVRALRVLERSPSGRVLRLEVALEGGDALVLRGDDLRRVLRWNGRPLPSTRFEPLPEGLGVAGSGWGHGVGMCQWGAIGMARAGKGFLEILEHYYPGTQVVPSPGKG